MGNYTISRKPKSTAVGPEPQLTVRLAETPATADLSGLIAAAYPVGPKSQKVKKRKDKLGG